jgi:hypothetical protein
MHLVTDCPCGQQHEIRQAVSALYTHKEARMDSTMPITTSKGRFRVPRIWLACHTQEITGPAICDAAVRYGFERIS